MAFTAVYPTAHSDTYVRATSEAGTNYEPWRATDPAGSLTGNAPNWQSLYESVSNQKFNIDLPSAETVTRIYLENYHFSGTLTDRGINNFEVYGTNNVTASQNTTYADTTNLTLLGTFQADAHTAADESDPQYFDLSSNTTAYAYYVFRLTDNRGSTDYMGARLIELQTGEVEPEADVVVDGSLGLGGTVSLGIYDHSVSGALGLSGTITGTTHNNNVVGNLGLFGEVSAVEQNSSVEGDFVLSGSITAGQRAQLQLAGALGLSGGVSVTTPDVLAVGGALSLSGNISLQKFLSDLSGELVLSGTVDMAQRSSMTIAGDFLIVGGVTADAGNSPGGLPAHSSARWS